MTATELKSAIDTVFAERDALRAQLAALNTAVDVAQGQARRYVIYLPSIDATRSFTEPFYDGDAAAFVRRAREEWSAAEATPDGGVAIFSNGQPPSIVLNFRRYDSSNINDPWGPEEPETFSWQLA